MSNNYYKWNEGTKFPNVIYNICEMGGKILKEYKESK